MYSYVKRSLIKIVCGLDIWRLKTKLYFKNTNQLVTKLAMKCAEEQRSVAAQCKQNPKAFWKYINSKQKSTIDIGDLDSVDEHGNPVMVSMNMEKAGVGQFFLECFYN